MSFNFEPQNHKIVTQTPFRFWVQKTIPLVYDDSLSYYELLCKVVNYLNETMENVSSLGNSCNSMFEGFNELKKYCNTYFKNLNVQTEINKKLDSMSEDGTLTTIITNFLKLNTARIFKSVKEMLYASSFDVNSYVRCLGYYEQGDGGGCYYKITRIYNNHAITIANGLFALPIILEDYVTPLQFGAKGDNEADDTDYINKALDYGYAHNKYLLFPFGKTFLISRSININTMNDYKIVNNATIHAKAAGTTNSADTQDYQYMVFFMKYCNNIDLKAGHIYSERVYYEKPPNNHVAENTNGSNVCGVACVECNNIRVHHYTAKNLEYAIGCLGYSENNPYNDNITIEDFEIELTSQPIFFSFCKNSTIKNGKMEECPNLGRGHHFIYLDSNKYCRIENVRMSYTSGHYGTAINASNAANTAISTDPSQYDDSTDPTQVDIFNVVINECYQPITAKAKTVVNIYDSVFSAFSGDIPNISSTWTPTIFLNKEYSTINCYNSVFNFDKRYYLKSFDRLLKHSLNLNHCKVKCGSIFTVDNTNSADKECCINVKNSTLDFIGEDSYVANILDTATYKFTFYNTLINSDKKYIIRVNFDTVKVTAINTTLNYNGENGAFISLYQTTGDYYTPSNNICICNFVGKNCGSVCNKESYAENIIKNNNFIYTENTE